MEKRIKLISKLSVLCLAFIIVGAVAYEIGQRNVVTLYSTVEVEGKPIKGRVRYWINRGAGWILLDMNPNVVVTAGLTVIRDYLRANADDTDWQNATAVSLSNNTATPDGTPNATWTQLYGEITTGGLDRIFGSNVNNKNTTCYNVTHTFTASATHTAVRISGLHWNNTSNATGDLFAANKIRTSVVSWQTFTSTTLYRGLSQADSSYNSDQLKIERDIAYGIVIFPKLAYQSPVGIG